MSAMVDSSVRLAVVAVLGTACSATTAFAEHNRAFSTSDSSSSFVVVDEGRHVSEPVIVATSDSPSTLTYAAPAAAARPLYHTDPNELATGHIPDLPPSRPGQCYALAQTPALYRRYQEQVVVKPESTRTISHPARYEQVQERRLVSEGQTTYRTIPAVYKDVTEQILVKPETVRHVEVPATYRNVPEKVLVSPARKLWKRGHGPITRVDEATGEILCLVEEPARYRTEMRRELVTPATTRAIVEPARFRTVTRRVMVEPERRVPIHVPAKYGYVTVPRLVEPERQEVVVTPARFGTRTRAERIQDPGLEWKPILCQTNLTSGVIRNVELALNRRGYHPGPVDGVMDSQTRSALNRYQHDTGLYVSSSLTLETLDSLGVAPQTHPVTVTHGPPTIH